MDDEILSQVTPGCDDDHKYLLHQEDYIPVGLITSGTFPTQMTEKKPKRRAAATKFTSKFRGVPATTQTDGEDPLMIFVRATECLANRQCGTRWLFG